MLSKSNLIQYALSFPDTYEDHPFRQIGHSMIRYHGNKKSFLLIYEKDHHLYFNVKVSPQWRDLWRNAYTSVLPAYHQNKEHWITVLVDGSIPDSVLKQMIGESYDLITDSPTKRIYEAVKRIPKGKVATYGQIAALAGNPKMARAVGNALHNNPDPDTIPCYRVVNSKGKLSGAFAFGGEASQQQLLEQDNISVVDGYVDLKKYGMQL